MDELFKQRRATHLTRMMKYLRLVFNDQFTIAIMFFVGGLGYWYSGFLKSLEFAWWEKFIGMALMIGLLQAGRLATLLKPADKVFLMAQEVNMERYLKKGFWHSMWLAQFMQVIGLIVMLPFLQVAFQASFIQALWLFPTFIVFKALILYDQMQSYYSQHNLIWLKIVLPLITFALFGVRLDMAWAFVFVLLAAAGRMIVRDKFWQGMFAWNQAIEDEASRQLSIYRFFNLFTDVPLIQGKTKRRAWLDGWFNRLPKNKDNVYTNLYWRGLLRGDEYFGLMVRLTVIGGIAAYFVHDKFVTPLILVLIVYLIGFQLLPLYDNYDEIVFTRLYPTDAKMRQKNFNGVLVRSLSLVGFVMVLANVVGQFNLVTLIISVVLVIAEIMLFSFVYVPRRLAKKQQ